jgi:hypothetical protein
MSLSELQKAESIVQDLISSSKGYEIEFDSTQTVKGLTKIPLISNHVYESGMQYKLISEAQKEEKIQISETDTVKELDIYNQSEYPVLIPCGTVLVGGRQDRTITTDVMVPGGEKIKIPSACVEQGRWSYRRSSDRQRIFNDLGIKNYSGSNFYARGLSSPRITHGLIGSVSRLRASRSPGTVFRSFMADQSEVWRNVQKEIEEADVETPTSAYTEVLIEQQKEDDIEFEIYDGEIGDIFVGNGKVLGMEIYETPKIWQDVSEQTIKRYKTGTRKQTEFENSVVEAFLETIGKSETNAGESIGMGYDVRIVGEEIDGSSLIIGNDPNLASAHLTVLPKQESRLKRTSLFDGSGELSDDNTDLTQLLREMGSGYPRRGNPIVPNLYREQRWTTRF